MLRQYSINFSYSESKVHNVEIIKIKFLPFEYEVVLHRYLPYVSKVSFPLILQGLCTAFTFYSLSLQIKPHVLRESSNRNSIYKLLFFLVFYACVLKAISHGNTLLVSNDLIPPLLHTKRIDFFQKMYALEFRVQILRRKNQEYQIMQKMLYFKSCNRLIIDNIFDIYRNYKQTGFKKISIGQRKRISW